MSVNNSTPHTTNATKEHKKHPVIPRLDRGIQKTMELDSLVKPENDIFGANVLKSLKGSRGGFTLLELMVSFAIIGLLAVIIASALRVSLGAVDRADRMVDSLERIRISINMINSQIQSQLPLTYDENGERKYYFEGDRESMRLSTNYSIWNSQGGYVLVRYEVVSDDAGKKSLMAQENIIGIENIMQTELFRGLDEIYFEYFYKGPTDEHGDWVEEWHDSGTLPEKIRLNISYDRFEFSMIITVKTAGQITDLSTGRLSI